MLIFKVNTKIIILPTLRINKNTIFARKIEYKMKKGVIFDMDGVLVDNRDAHFEAFIIFCHEYGLELDRQKLDSLFGMTNEEIIPAILPADLIAKKGLKALGDEKEAVYRRIYAETIEPTKGLIPFLQELKAAGIKTAVGSSGNTENVNYVLEKCNIAQYFDAIANGDMITKGKPDPEVFLLAAEKMGLKPSECVVIEDSFAGIKAARNANMSVIAMATTFPPEKNKD